LTVSFILLILAVTSLTFLFTFRETQKALKEVTQTELMALASVIAGEFSGAEADSMSVFQPGDETALSFIAIRDKLKSIKQSHSDIKYLYTMKKTGDRLTFMVDADYGNTEDPGAKVGEKYTEENPELLKGFEKASVDREFTTDKWGTLLSGYAPLRDSKGSVIGIVGVDMASNMVMQKQAFIGKTIYIIMAFGILLAGLFILIFSKTIIKDVHKLNRVANDISMGKMDVDMDVTRKDEIGELAESFGRMVASLKIMMMTNNDDIG
jgi:HAMP domain-containing protein